jgi:hypothetical protein
MSMLVIVTFDLHGAKPQRYRDVKWKLAALRLEKHIHVKNSAADPKKLPANTFAAKYSGRWTNRTAGELRDHIRSKVRGAVASLGLRATVFVVVGNTWAWGRCSVGGRTKRSRGRRSMFGAAGRHGSSTPAGARR